MDMPDMGNVGWDDDRTTPVAAASVATAPVVAAPVAAAPVAAAPVVAAPVAAAPVAAAAPRVVWAVPTATTAAAPTAARAAAAAPMAAAPTAARAAAAAPMAARAAAAVPMAARAAAAAPMAAAAAPTAAAAPGPVVAPAVAIMRSAPSAGVGKLMMSDDQRLDTGRKPLRMVPDAMPTQVFDAVTWWIDRGMNHMSPEQYDVGGKPATAWDKFDRTELNDAILMQAAPNTAHSLFMLCAIIGELTTMQTLWHDYDPDCYLSTLTRRYQEGSAATLYEERTDTILIAAGHAWDRKDMEMLDWLLTMVPERDILWSTMLAALAHAKGNKEIAARYINDAIREMQKQNMLKYQLSSSREAMIYEELEETLGWTYRECLVGTRQWLLQQLHGVCHLDEEHIACIFGQTIRFALLKEDRATLMRIITGNGESVRIIRLALIQGVVAMTVAVERLGRDKTELSDRSDRYHTSLLRSERMLREITGEYLFDAKTGELLPEVRPLVIEVAMYESHLGFGDDLPIFTRLFHLAPAEVDMIHAKILEHTMARTDSPVMQASTITRLYEQEMLDAERIQKDDDQLLCTAAEAKNLAMLSVLATTAYPNMNAGLHKNRRLLQIICETGELDMLDWLLNTHYDAAAKRASAEQIVQWWPADQREFIAEYLAITHLCAPTAAN